MTRGESKPPVICLMGPTATGKTAMALELVSRRNMQIISVDSAQVYQGMNIGTGKPNADILRRCPHRLIDIRDPVQPYSAADFRRDAMAEIRAVHERGAIPLLVGGTMLYFKALRDGLAELPEADGQTRRLIESRAATEGWGSVHAWLREVDPQSAARIHPNDPQRLQRALEVYLVSGQTLTDLQRRANEGATGSDNQLPFSLAFFAIQPDDRLVLHERIAARFHSMLRAGLVEEVQSLHDRGDLHSQLPSIKSVGYRQVWQYLDGRLDYDGMVEKSIIATRQLAKRQFTWLRSWPGLTSFSAPTTESIAKLLNYLDSSQYRN